MSIENRIVRKVSAPRRIAAKYFEQRYARLFAAMSVQEAKSILGFPPGVNPTPEEINKAFKRKVVENHPDLGGSNEKMVAVNVAKDILDGKGKATWQPDRSSPPRPKPRDYDATLEGETFASAMSDAGIPAGVEWKFVSVPEYYWESSNHPGHKVWVLYGQTDQKHVFLGLKERGESAGGVQTDQGFTKIMEDWKSSEIDVPISQPIAKIAAKYLKTIGMDWSDAKFKTGPRKFIAWPGGKPTKEVLHKIPRGGGVALKDILAGTSLLSDEEADASGRKSVVEIICKFNRERYLRGQKLKAEGKIKYLTGDWSYDFFVRVNGKECQLEDATIVNMGRAFIPFIMQNKVAEGKAFNVTRLQGRGIANFGAGTAIAELNKCLTTEPSWLHVALEKAEEEYPDSDTREKAANWADLRDQTTLKNASDAAGVSLFDFFTTLYGS